MKYRNRMPGAGSRREAGREPAKQAEREERLVELRRVARHVVAEVHAPGKRRGLAVAATA